jgi:hypothetical protein
MGTLLLVLLLYHIVQKDMHAYDEEYRERGEILRYAELQTGVTLNCSW